MCLNAPENVETSAIVFYCHESGGPQYGEYTNGIIGRDGFLLSYDAMNITINEKNSQTDSLVTRNVFKISEA